MSDPWERQPKEGPKPFEAFALYRDYGPSRSVRRVAEELGKSETLISRWSSAHGWVERVAAWDDAQDAIHREAVEQARREMAERHAQIATAMLARAAAGLMAMEPERLNPAQLARFVEVASKLERLSRGEPSDITEERTEPVTPEEIRRFLAGQ